MTPKPHIVDPDPEGLPYPLILEEFLPGRPLDYSTDLVPAARCIARIHEIGVPVEHTLQVHPDPAPAILEESRGLAAPYLEWDEAVKGSKAGLRKGFRKIEGFLERKGLFTRDDLAIVNYDLNTHNFVVSDAGTAKLLDREATGLGEGQDRTPRPGPRPLPPPHDDPVARRHRGPALRRAETGVRVRLPRARPRRGYEEVSRRARGDEDDNLAARRLVVRVGAAGDGAGLPPHHQRGDPPKEPNIPGAGISGGAVRPVKSTPRNRQEHEWQKRPSG